MMNLNDKQQKSLDAFRSFVGSDTFTKSDYTDFKVKAKELGVISPRFLIRNNTCEKSNNETHSFPPIVSGISFFIYFAFLFLGFFLKNKNLKAQNLKKEE